MHTITKRQLTYREASRLVEEMRSFPDIVYFSEDTLCNLPHTYVGEVDGHFAGICGVYEIGTWIKIGPLVVLREYQGRGLGRSLIDVVLHTYPDRHYLIMSSNSKVQRIVHTHHFTECRSFFSLPSSVKLALARQLVHMFSLRLIWEKLRKSVLYKRAHMRWYVRYNHDESLELRA